MIMKVFCVILFLYFIIYYIYLSPKIFVYGSKRFIYIVHTCPLPAGFQHETKVREY